VTVKFTAQRRSNFNNVTKVFFINKSQVLDIKVLEIVLGDIIKFGVYPLSQAAFCCNFSFCVLIDLDVDSYPILKLDPLEHIR
jgi:hypothetical protein